MTSLFLGGSVLDPYFSQVEKELPEMFSFNGKRDVRVFNLARPAHTSRDSWLKYSALEQSRFDLVVFYHGINDARANNVPPERYREDYSHYSWYERTNALVRHHGRARFALPVTLHYLWIALRQRWRSDDYMPMHEPRKDWRRYGGDLRSVASFQYNLTKILSTASRRGETVLLMTFAMYVPEDYSYRAFEAKDLDYGLHLSPLESWGNPGQVIKAVQAHNAVVERLAGQSNGEILFVDQANLLAGQPRYFNDACHFSVAGSSRFAENLFNRLWPHRFPDGGQR